jgi:hypothetical protein
MDVCDHRLRYIGPCSGSEWQLSSNPLPIIRSLHTCKQRDLVLVALDAKFSAGVEVLRAGKAKQAARGKVDLDRVRGKRGVQ